MGTREPSRRAEPGLSLPALERLAPPPPPGSFDARIDRHTSPGDVVVDLHARGGWVARVAIDRGRRAVSVESSPLTRLLADVVLRPPDVRHLDVAFQTLAGAARGRTTLRQAVNEPFATRCPACGRELVADEIVWDVAPARVAEPPAKPRGRRKAAAPEAVPEPAPGPGAKRARRPVEAVRKRYRCSFCREQQGGSELREADLDDDDRRRLATTPGIAQARTAIRGRFPVPEGGGELVDGLLALHTDRQLVGLGAILERIEADLRAEPVEAALRLSFLHAVVPASRLLTGSGRVAALKVADGRARPPSGPWRERNPWVAFEDGFRIVRGFVQRLAAGAPGPAPSRFGADLRSLAEGPANTLLRLGTAKGLRALAEEATDVAARPVRPRIRLAIGQPPVPTTPDATAGAFHATAWALGREAAATVVLDELLEPGVRSGTAQAAVLRRSLEAIEPAMDRDGRAMVLVESREPEALTSVALAGVAAGFRVHSAHLPGPDDGHGVVELLPPGAALPPGPRTRANVALPPVPGGAGDPDLVPARGVFGPPERYDRRPFSATEVARTATEVAIEVLRARGEPATTDRLFGEILVGLDRAGQLRRFVERDAAPSAPAEPDAGALARIIREELANPARRRVVEIEPGQWWLADRDDRAEAEAPLADRVEWAVYSLLSTAGPLSEPAFLDRVAALFAGRDQPEDGLVRACLDSYLAESATAERVGTDEDLLRRSHEHGELLALLADAGHRLGLDVWLSRREQSRRVGAHRLADLLDERERNVPLELVARGPLEELEAVDCIWYRRNQLAFAFEVEWTAMLGEPVLRRHGRIPADDNLVRFLCIPPERAALVRYKLNRSPALRAALADGNWHVLKWNQLRAFLAAEQPDLAALEPRLGLEPTVERSGEQLPLFSGAR